MKHRFEGTGRGLSTHLVESRSQMLCSLIGKHIFLFENTIRLDITKRHCIKTVTADRLSLLFPKKIRTVLKEVKSLTKLQKNTCIRNVRKQSSQHHIMLVLCKVLHNSSLKL